MSRARFACVIHITRFGKSVSFGNLDGDSAPHTRRIHFPQFLKSCLRRKMCFGSLCRSTGFIQSMHSVKMKKVHYNKNGKPSQDWDIFPWWSTQKIRIVIYEGMGSGIPIKIAGDPQNTNCGKCGLQANLALC